MDNDAPEVAERVWKTLVDIRGLPGSGAPIDCPTCGFQRGAGLLDTIWNGADSTRGPLAEQSASMSYPQAKRPSILRFPQYPQFRHQFGSHKRKGRGRPMTGPFASAWTLWDVAVRISLHL